MDRLFIHLMDGDHVDALLLEQQGSGTKRFFRGPLPQLAEHAQGCRVVVLVPTERLIVTRVAVPTSNRQRQLQAVPFLLEELLADDVEQLHFALGGYQNGEVAVMVTAHSQMRQWMSRLTEAGLRPHRMVPDLLALPFFPEEKCWSLFLTEERVLVRTGIESGFACEPANLPLLLGQALEQAGDQAPEVIRAKVCEEYAERVNMANFLPEGAESEMVSCREGVLPLLAQDPVEASEGKLDLLQGPYSQRERLGKLWRPWRPVAALLVLLLLVKWAEMGVSYHRLKEEKEQLATQVQQSFRAGFPDIKRVVNPRLQAERALNALREQKGRAGFLALLAGIGPHLKEISGLRLRGLNYKEGKLVVGLRLENLQQLDALEKKLKQQPGISVEVLSASSRGRKVEARIRVEAAA